MSSTDTTTTNSSNTSSSAQVGTISDAPWKMDEGRGIYEKLASTLPQKYKPYKGERVADFGTGYGIGKDILVDMFTNGGGNLDTAGHYLSGWAGSPNNDMSKTAADYVNPYLDEVLSPALRDINRAREGQLLEENRSATMSGAFGDAQAGIGRALSNDRYNELLADTSGKMRADAYDKGQTQANTVMARMANAPGMFAALEKAIFDRDSALTKAFTSYGLADQAQEQKHHDVAFEEDQLQKGGYALKRAQALMQLLGLAPAQKTTTSAATGTSTGTGTTETPDNSGFDLLGKTIGAVAGAPAGGFIDKLFTF